MLMDHDQQTYSVKVRQAAKNGNTVRKKFMKVNTKRSSVKNSSRKHTFNLTEALAENVVEFETII